MSARKKSEKLDVGDATVLVREYLAREYRPYAVSDLLLNLHNRVSKNVLVTVLDTGVENGVFVVKRYGKLSFYCSAEKSLPSAEPPLTLAHLQQVQSVAENLWRQVADAKRAIASLPGESDTQLTERVESLKLRKEQLQQIIAGMDQVVVDTVRDTGPLEERARKLSRVLQNVMSTLREAKDMRARDFAEWLRDSLGVAAVSRSTC